MFSFEADFSLQDLENLVNGGVNSWIDNITDVYRKLGKQFTQRARAKTREDGGFGNITWNLRGSIGYALVKEDRSIEVYFPPISTGAEGNQTGEDYAREIALLADEGEGVMLILVAGMDYAKLVEATERDVISVSTLTFEKELKDLLR